MRIHLTNLHGLGASRLAKSLLPAIERNAEPEALYLPEHGDLARYIPRHPSTKKIHYQRQIPNAMSRVLECTMFGSRFDATSPLLVLGDIPLATSSKQTVFLQNANILNPEASHSKLGKLKNHISRELFVRNARYVRSIIVQSSMMKEMLVDQLPITPTEVHIVAQPAPTWLKTQREIREHLPLFRAEKGLNLFYPAAKYPHKNHKILGVLSSISDWQVAEIKLTIDPQKNPAPQLPQVNLAHFRG